MTTFSAFLERFNGISFNEVRTKSGTVFTLGQPYLQTPIIITGITLVYDFIRVSGDNGITRYYLLDAMEYLDPLD